MTDLPIRIREKFREIQEHKAYGDSSYVSGIGQNGLLCELVCDDSGKIFYENHVPWPKSKARKSNWLPKIALAAGLFLTFLGINHFNASHKTAAEKKTLNQIVQSASIPEIPEAENGSELGWPCENHNIGKKGNFGATRKWKDPHTKIERIYSHKAIDIPEKIGSNVFAAASGRVNFVGRGEREGKYIVIKHELDGKKIYTSYMHLNEIDVCKGDSVQRKEKIGTVGITGNANQAPWPHLHFAVAVNGMHNFENPLGFLQEKSRPDAMAASAAVDSFLEDRVEKWRTASVAESEPSISLIEKGKRLLDEADICLSSENALYASPYVQFQDANANAETGKTSYSVRSGESLWRMAERFGVPRNSIASFIDELVDEQQKYSDNSAFIKRLNRSGGNAILPDDKFVLSQELAEKYRICEKNMTEAKYAKANSLEKITKAAKIAKRANNNDGGNGLLVRYALMRGGGSNLMKESGYREDFNNIVERTAIAYNLGARPGDIARQSSEAILQNADDVYKVLGMGLRIGGRLKGRFSCKIADASGDLGIISNGYAEGKSYKAIALEFTEKTGMGISSSSIYRTLKRQNLFEITFAR